mmetsp:Transcript_46006/g.41173  ORF Transcript_46006/g.41173 Transcript_46006/m.41173 type:complete len:310 (-) Transcript_46006:91-1020(-)
MATELVPSDNVHRGSSFDINIPMYGSQKTVSLEIPLKADLVDDYEAWFHGYNDIIDQIKEWASAQENLDVYQMNSFYAGISNKRRQFVNYYKTAMVFFIQTAGAGYLAYNEFTTPSSDGAQLCNVKDFHWLSWMAFAFTGFISLTLNDQLTELNQQGIYRFKNNLPPFFNKFWLSSGIFINTFVLAASWVVSVIVIFLATNPLDMILNSIAVYFIIELDDMMVNRIDYEFIDTWLDDEYEMWMRMKYEKRRKFGYEVSCIEKLGRCILWCSSCTENAVVKWIIRFLALATPIAVLICFNQSFDGSSPGQ